MKSLREVGRARRYQRIAHSFARFLLVLLCLSAPILRAGPATQPSTEPPSAAAASALDKVQELINNGDSVLAAQAARTALGALPSSQALSCAAIDELRLIAASAPQQNTGAAEWARLQTQAQQCGGRLLARGLDIEALQLLNAGDFGTAYERAKRSVTVWEESASGSLELAEAMTTASILAIRLSLPQEGIPYARAALELCLTELGADSIAVQKARSNLASLYWIGREELRAESLYREALAATERVRGPRHRDVARLLMNLGGLYSWLSDHVQAREMLERAREIFEDPLSAAQSDDRLRALHMLGEEYMNSGRTANAIGLFEAALAERERLFSVDDGRTRALRRTMSGLYLSLRRFDEARRLADQELALLAAEDRESSAYGAWMLTTLARVRMHEASMGRGDFESALNTASKALEIRRLLGNRPAIAVATLQLATHQYVASDLAAAGETLRQFDLAFNPDNLPVAHDFVLADFLRAKLSRASGEVAKAADLVLTVEDRERETLRQQLRGFSEGDAVALSSAKVDGLSLGLSLALEHASKIRTDQTSDAAAYPFALWQRVAARRGMVFGERQQRQRAVLNNRDPVQRSAWNAWIAASRAHSVAASGDDSKALGKAQKGLEQAERMLGLSVGEASLVSPPLPDKSWLANLPRNARLLSFVRFRMDHSASPTRASRGPESDLGVLPAPQLTDVDHYAVLVGSRSGAVRLLDLGTAARIDAAVAAWRASAAWPAANAADYAQLHGAGRALAALIWDPLVPVIGDAERVYVVPTGSLYEVNFAALPLAASTSARADKGVRYLAESGPLILNLNHERELRPIPRPEGRGLLLVGDVEFGAYDRSSRMQRCGSLAGISFAPLPGSAAEIDALAESWLPALGPVSSLRRSAASKDALRAHVAGKRIVHLASHGFFLDDCDAAIVGSRGVGGLGAASASRADGTGLKQDTRPSTRPDLGEFDEPIAGIALAGANRRDAVTAQSEGILSVGEAASLNLESAEWVVVSACDSARSTARSWEGSFGLRRALAFAGARTTIMSSWAVQDDAAKEFMVDLYHAHFNDGLATAEAVRSVYRQRLVALRKAGDFDDPYRWAAFVAIGN